MVAVFFMRIVPMYGQGFEITHETEYKCVDLILWEEDEAAKKAKPQTEPTENAIPDGIQNHERTAVGVGEPVKLGVTGKVTALGDKSKIKWTITQDGDWACFLVDEKDAATVEGEEAQLYIKLATSAANDKVVKVLATSTSEREAEIEFTIKTPDREFKSRHDTPPTPSRIIQKGRVGAAAILRVFPTPTSVNFGGGVGILERDKKSPSNVRPTDAEENAGSQPSIFKNWRHLTIDDNYALVSDETGCFYDRVWCRFPNPRLDITKLGTVTLDYKKITTQHSCEWVCQHFWKTIEKEDEKAGADKTTWGEEMKDVTQSFTIANDGNGTTSISKFDSSVTRSAKSNGSEQIYTNK
jgi:hypothetical protein